MSASVGSRAASCPTSVFQAIRTTKAYRIVTKPVGSRVVERMMRRCLLGLGVLGIAAWKLHSGAHAGAREVRAVTALAHALDVATGGEAGSEVHAAIATVTISGIVVDEADRTPVAGVEVVFRGDAGEATTATDDAG